MHFGAPTAAKNGVAGGQQEQEEGGQEKGEGEKTQREERRRRRRRSASTAEGGSVLRVEAKSPGSLLVNFSSFSPKEKNQRNLSLDLGRSVVDLWLDLSGLFHTLFSFPGAVNHWLLLPLQSSFLIISAAGLAGLRKVAGVSSPSVPSSSTQLGCYFLFRGRRMKTRF